MAHDVVSLQTSWLWEECGFLKCCLKLGGEGTTAWEVAYKSCVCNAHNNARGSLHAVFAGCIHITFCYLVASL